MKRTVWKQPILAAVLGAALALSAASCGEEESVPTDSAADSGEITVTDAWVRATTGTDDPTMTAAFMVISNGTDEDVILESASSPVTEMVQIHEMVMSDGAMMMQEAPNGVTVRAGKEQMLMPGGYHVMLMNLADELAVGDEVDLSLQFSDGTTIDLSGVPVKEFTEEEGHYHSPGASDHSHSPSASPTM